MFLAFLYLLGSCGSRKIDFSRLVGDASKFTNVPSLRVLISLLWKFVKELVILFHRISAAPWGHVVSTIKRAPFEDSSSFFHSHRC